MSILFSFSKTKSVLDTEKHGRTRIYRMAEFFGSIYPEISCDPVNPCPIPSASLRVRPCPKKSGQLAQHLVEGFTRWGRGDAVGVAEIEQTGDFFFGGIDAEQGIGFRKL